MRRMTKFVHVDMLAYREGSVQSYFSGEETELNGDSVCHKGNTLGAIKGQTSKENINTRMTCKEVDKTG